MRCVKPNTVSEWKSVLAVTESTNGKIAYANLEHVQPTHTVAIARAVRQVHGEEWGEDVFTPGGVQDRSGGANSTADDSRPV